MTAAGNSSEIGKTETGHC